MKSVYFAIAGLWGVLLLPHTAIANELTLRDALQKTLQGHPELQQYPYQQRMAEAEKLQASLRPNPVIGFELENLAGSGRNQGVQSAQATLSFSQLIELGGKREQRIEFASAKQRQLEAEFAYAKTEVLAETASRFYRLVQLQALAHWNQQQQQRLSNALNIASTRVKSGAVAPSEITRISLQKKRTEADFNAISGQLTEARARLSGMWASAPEFESVRGTFARDITLPTVAKVEAAVNQAPELLRLADSEQLLAAKAQALSSAATADLTLGMGVRYNNEFEDAGLILKASMPLQLSDPNAGLMQSNRAERDMLVGLQHSVREQLRVRTRAVMAQLQRHEQYLQSIQDTLLPLAQQLETEIQAGYARGAYNLLQVLDAQNELAQLEAEQINRRYAIYHALLELERLTGQAFLGSSK
ncbi:TolC family protein [Lacimicrobium alkaliphilum]|uniref:Cobalt transporter n=1 Tax=Lacimicrobium alkaliphilum TaxID=1526571 RepID=A0A0U3AKX8_9ALTE|nr:TolC family protein [Lacimicrobium alkaliphilum]ALS99425.1 cobalt transporter [Lacimicrobium alkaliphilum]